MCFALRSFLETHRLSSASFPLRTHSSGQECGPATHPARPVLYKPEEHGTRGACCSTLKLKLEHQVLPLLHDSDWRHWGPETQLGFRGPEATRPRRTAFASIISARDLKNNWRAAVAWRVTGRAPSHRLRSALECTSEELRWSKREQRLVNKHVTARRGIHQLSAAPLPFGRGETTIPFKWLIK